MLKGVKLNDRIKVPTQRKFTDSGQLIVPCAFARTGTQLYSAGSLGLTDRKPDEAVTVIRDEADVFDEASVESFRSVPVTVGHPAEGMVTADNAAKLQVGMLEGMPVRDENKLSGTLVIARKDAIDLIEEGLQELSAGYTCDIEMVVEDGEEKIYQRNIRANHIAIVDKGRAGPHVRIADEGEDSSVDEADGKDDLVVGDEDETKVSDEPEATEEVVDEPVEDKSAIKDITEEINEANKAKAEVVEEPAAEPVADSAEVVATELQVGDEGYEVYAALNMLNDEIKAVNDYTDAIQFCEDEALVKVFKYVLAEEQDHCIKLLDWLATQNTEGSTATIDAAEELVSEARKTERVSIQDELKAANQKIELLNDEVEAGVEARVNAILVAKDLTDIDDFSGKSISEIRKLVVTDQLPNLDLTDKDEAYINARFDILCEDNGISSETSMGKLLRDNARAEVTTPEPYVSPVLKARQAMIERQRS